MFCRFCGSQILEDSLFCSKCGKKLRRSENPRFERISKLLRLRTPYPYAIFLFLLAAAWILTPEAAPVDYKDLKWTFETNRKLDLPDENLYQQGFSLVLENGGSKAVKDVPIDFTARIEPAQVAQISTTFQGNRLPIMESGKTIPLTVVLSDEVRPGARRSFLLEGSIEAKPPFKVTYEVREQRSEVVLASLVVER
jgi:hypothetical protein